MYLENERGEEVETDDDREEPPHDEVNLRPAGTNEMSDVNDAPVVCRSHRWQSTERCFVDETHELTYLEYASKNTCQLFTTMMSHSSTRDDWKEPAE